MHVSNLNVLYCTLPVVLEETLEMGEGRLVIRVQRCCTELEFGSVCSGSGLDRRGTV